MTEEPDTPAPAGRPPRGLAETVTANLRPQPAIPAVLVFLLTILWSVGAATGPGEPSAWLLLVPAGLATSCALAIAAGFCSFFPQLAWILLAAWALKFAGVDGPLPAYNRYLLLVGMAAAAAAAILQFWRVRTGRFQPTITDN